jgi:hypothetical protein
MQLNVLNDLAEAMKALDGKKILRRFLTPATVILPGLHDLYLRDNLLASGHGDGHILTVTVALLLAILTGRSDLCIAGVFGAGKNALPGGTAYSS